MIGATGAGLAGLLLASQMIVHPAAWRLIVSCACCGCASGVATAPAPEDLAVGMRCTDIGCGSVATFESQALSLTIAGSHVEVCRNQECSGATFPSDHCVDIHLAAADGTPVLNARAIATYALVHPNGEGCAPACPLASLSPSD